MVNLSFFTDSSNQADLEKLGVKFTPGGAHISRTMMLAELDTLLACVPEGAPAETYIEAVISRNELSKTTDSTRQKTLRHLRELYGLDKKIPLFRLLRKMHALDNASLPLLAIQIATARDTLLRATCTSIFDAAEGEIVETTGLEKAIVDAFPGQYSDANKIARNERLLCLKYNTLFANLEIPKPTTNHEIKTHPSRGSHCSADHLPKRLRAVLRRRWRVSWQA